MYGWLIVVGAGSLRVTGDWQCSGSAASATQGRTDRQTDGRCGEAVTTAGRNGQSQIYVVTFITLSYLTVPVPGKWRRVLEVDFRCPGTFGPDFSFWSWKYWSVIFSHGIVYFIINVDYQFKNQFSWPPEISGIISHNPDCAMYIVFFSSNLDSLWNDTIVFFGTGSKLKPSILLVNS